MGWRGRGERDMGWRGRGEGDMGEGRGERKDGREVWSRVRRVEHSTVQHHSTVQYSTAVLWDTTQHSAYLVRSLLAVLVFKETLSGGVGVAHSAVIH